MAKGFVTRLTACHENYLLAIDKVNTGESTGESKKTPQTVFEFLGNTTAVRLSALSERGRD